MAPKLLLLCLLMLAVSLTYGQDLITRSDGEVIKATVLEMPPGLLRFKLYQQADTLVYQISTRDVASVRMADGTTKTFPEAAAAKNAAPPFNYYTSSGRNILWFYPLELVYPTVALAYERMVASGKIGFKIPLMIGLYSGNTSNNYNTDIRQNTRFGTGLDMNIYPFGQGRFQYYVGPAFQYRSYRGYFYNTYSSSQPGPKIQNTSLVSLALKTGVYYQFSRFFCVSVDAGLGYRFLRDAHNPDYNFTEHRNRQILTGNLYLGYRF
jgi:hypothetical protein